MNEWLTSAITGGTAILSSLLTAMTTYAVGNRQFKFQLQEERKRRLTELQERRFQIYNTVRRQVGEVALVEPQPPEELDVNLYRRLIRPHLYEGFHIIDGDVRNLVEQLDCILGSIDIRGDRGEPIEENEQETAADIYRKLIYTIKNHYPENFVQFDIQNGHKT